MAKNTKVSEKADFKIEDSGDSSIGRLHERTERCKDLWRC